MKNNNNLHGKHFIYSKAYDFPAIEHAKQVIEENIIDHWSLTLLAARVGVNEFKLKIGFKQIYQITPYQYLKKLRLKKAKGLLERTTLSIQQITSKVGFESYRAFSKSFRGGYSMLPTTFREDMGNDLIKKAISAKLYCLS